MLRELHIQNLAVIEDAAVTLDAGLNVFTGQTGAGKSLVIGAFEALLGLRSASGMLRKGADEGRVSGVFEVEDAALAAEVGVLVDQEIEPGDGLLITRKLHASGRSSVSVNGQPVTAKMLKAVGQLLVDIHGQHDHQHLLRPGNQLKILDTFAGASALREQFAALHGELRALRERMAELKASGTLRRQQLELYEFQAEEIDQAELYDGEFVELQARHSVLSNVQKLQGDAGQVYAAMYEADGSIVERLQALTHVLIDLAEMDGEGLDAITESVRQSTLTLQEAAYELSRYVDRLEHDPTELAEVADRLNTLNRLIQKYGDGMKGDDPLAAVLAYRAQIGGQIDTLREEDDDLSSMQAKVQAMELDLVKVGEALRGKRVKAAKRLVEPVEAELKELGMAEARLRIELEEVAAADAGPSGLDAVEVMVQTNPGQGFAPLRKIASGGEMSRVMLALKGVLATGDRTGSGRVSVLVFDEIDANIGGRLGGVIGQKLRGLTRRGGQQVLCITHLPQLAAFGDRHLHIHKQVSGSGKGRATATNVAVLDPKARLEELAAMMAGDQATATTRKQAKELMSSAAG